MKAQLLDLTRRYQGTVIHFTTDVGYKTEELVIEFKEKGLPSTRQVQFWDLIGINREARVANIESELYESENQYKAGLSLVIGFNGPGTLEKLTVQLQHCLVAAKGCGLILQEDAFGYSPSYEAVLKLWQRYASANRLSEIQKEEISQLNDKLMQLEYDRRVFYDRYGQIKILDTPEEVIKLRKKAAEEIEQLETKLAGCSVAAKGYGEPIGVGSYGHSASYDDVLELWNKYENLLKENEELKARIESIKDLEEPFQ